MKRTLTLLFSVLLSSILFGQTLPFDKVANYGGTGDDKIHDICFDKLGNRYIAGTFKNSIDFGNGVEITSVDNADAFIAKYDADGNILWANGFGGSLTDYADAIAVDNDGNIITASRFYEKIVFGTDTLVGKGSWDIAIAKFDSYGNYLWMKHAYTPNKDEATDIKIDSQGNYVVLGYYDVADSIHIPMKYESLEIYSHGERDIFVIKMDSEGNPLWGVTAGGFYDDDNAGGLAIDENDNIYFNGSYTDTTAIFGTIELVQEDGDDLFLAKLNSSGSYLWAVSATGAGDDVGKNLEYVQGDGTNTGKLLVTGYFEDSLYVGAENNLFKSTGNDDVFVFTYSKEGAYESGFSFGSDAEEQANVVTYIPGSDGDYLISGHTKGDLILPNETLANFGSKDMFIMKVHQDSLVWAKNYGGSSIDEIYSAAINDEGEICFAGHFKSSSAQFNDITLTNNGGYDLWMGQMHEPTPFSAPVILSISDIPNDQGGKVRIEFSASELTNSFSVWRQIDSTSDWDAIGSFDGIYQNKYSYVAPTLGDSTISGIKWSNFKVSAHSSEMLNFLVSESMLGYSIDNLAPIVPAGVIASGYDDMIELAWDESVEKDFQYYAIYRSLDSEFTPDTMITSTYTTTNNYFNDNEVIEGYTYYYHISAVDYSGNYSEFSEKVYALITDVQLDIDIPTVYELGQNYPNPFNPSTVVNYSIPESGLVTLKVFNILGQEIVELVNEVKQVGVYEVSFNASSLTTGMYIYRIQSGDFTSTKKMILIK